MTKRIKVRKHRFVLALLLGSLVGPANAQAPASPAITTSLPANWVAETVLRDLDYPWDLTSSGRQVVITEKAGNILMLGGEESATRYKLETSVPIVTDGGGGLLGLALAADFPSSGKAWVYHSYERDGEPLNRVIEVSFDGSGWHEIRPLLESIPGHRLYNGGRIAIGPDGFLYVTTGWTESQERPQDLESLAGKVLRMTLDGHIPADNPFPASYVWSFGHRNPQGLAWNDNGDLYVAEHGQSALDEINLIRRGANYGWPLISGDEASAGMMPPTLHSGDETWAPSGVAFAGDDLLVATLRGGGLFAFNESARRLRVIYKTSERIRDVLLLDGSVYMITTNRSPRASGPSDDRLVRLTPVH